MGKIQFWIKAFIPREFENLMFTVSRGPHAGETAINGPIPGVSDCYLTDNREFTSVINASCRMHSEIEIDVESLGFSGERHYCDPTIEIDCEDGTVECTKSADSGRMHFLRAVKSGSVLTLDLEAAANNGCFTGSPDIDYEGTLKLDKAKRILEFTGKVDDFPAFEAYVAIDGIVTKLFAKEPKPGSSPWNLPGNATRAVYGRVSF